MSVEDVGQASSLGFPSVSFLDTGLERLLDLHYFLLKALDIELFAFTMCSKDVNIQRTT